MDFSAVCRTCLSTQSLNPIFLDRSDHRRYSTAVYIITGVKVELEDGLPQQMCTLCVNYMNDSLKFRKQCKDTETELLRIKNEIKNCRDPNTTLADEKDTVDIKEIKSHIRKTNRNKCLAAPTLSDSKKQSRISTDDDMDIKMEYMNYNDLDEDDKPLKFLIENDEASDDTTDNIHDPSDSRSDLEVDTNTVINTKEQIDTDVWRIDADRLYNINNQIDPKRKRVTCKLCQKNLSIRSIDSHMARRHPGADERRIKCDLCDNYIIKEKLNRHKKLMHGTGCFRCGYCKSEFDSKEVLVQHVTTCTAKKKKRKLSASARELAECDVCHKTMQRASLRMHKAIKHAGLGPVCEHCGRRFGNKFRLNEHYRAKHGYEKFKCTHCEFQSAGIMAMRNHERRHRGEKPFVCERCGAKFHAAYLLAQHRQSHRTEKLVKCDQCSASFKANNSLHMHKITCHSSLLFKCTMCSRAYSCRHYAVKHLRKVHQYTGPVPPLQSLSSVVAENTGDPA